jgi:hypothetical protein
MLKILASVVGGYSLARLLEAQEAGVPLDLAFKNFGQPVARIRARLTAESAAPPGGAAWAAAVAKAGGKVPTLHLPGPPTKKKKGAGMGAFRIPRRAFRVVQGG